MASKRRWTKGRRRSKSGKLRKEQRLLKAYGDPEEPGSLVGVRRFAHQHRLSVPEASRILEKDFIQTGLYTDGDGEATSTPYPFLYSVSTDSGWPISSRCKLWPGTTRGNLYFLTVVDILSKYAWVEPVKSKRSVAVTKAFEKILKRADGRKPRKLQTDDGKEFYNKTFETLMKKEDIVHFSTKGDTKASVMERFHSTFKQRMHLYFTSANTFKYLPMLQVLVKEHIDSCHRTTGMAPL